MEMLGARLARLYPKCKVLVLSNPFTKESGYLNEKNQYEQAGLRGLRKGLGGRSPVKVVFPEIRPEYFANPQSVIIPPEVSQLHDQRKLLRRQSQTALRPKQ